jgi:CheY-like chemotaxis protein
MRFLYIEDDEFFGQHYAGHLIDHGAEVELVGTAERGLNLARDGEQYDGVIVDIKMHRPEKYTQVETAGGLKTGVAIIRELAYFLPGAVFIALTNSDDAHVEAFFDRPEQYWYCHKPQFSDADAFARYAIERVWRAKAMLRPFIVHGHNMEAVYELKNYLQNYIGLEEPVILAEKPSRGRTLIEKFEEHAAVANVVFALFTADDLVGEDERRARQNVLFEYGYFVGRLGRGRVFLLYEKGVALPSDLHGIVYIDITNGIVAAGEEIRRELKDIWGPAA